MRLVLLPGLGADARLFEAQRRAFPHLEVPQWLPPAAGETLADYGRRMAQSVGASGGELVVGGVSFGGMVACEMARHLPARAVALIASCPSAASLPRTRRVLARAARRVPTAAFHAARPLWRVAALAFGPATRAALSLVRDFVWSARFSFVRWGFGALAEWTPREGPPCPVRAVHGAADRLIPARRLEVERLVPGAGHLVNLTHVAEVNDFLHAVMLDVRLRETTAADRGRVRAFYRSCGHSGELAAADRVVVAERNGEIVGAVRLCVEEGVQVLRTMRVRPDAQRRGIGRSLLRRFETMLASGPCYCLPYGHLSGFYGAIRFEEVDARALPPHVARRLAQYRAERPGVTMIAMRRP